MSRKRMERDFIAADDEPVSGEELGEGDESDLENDYSSDEGLGRMRGSRGARGGAGVNGKGVSTRSASSRDKGKGKAWEGQFERTWDMVQEDERGTLEGAVSDMLLTSKSRRVLRDTASIQRGIIRHVYLVIDLSSAMLVRDFKATWLDLTLQYAQDFVNEFFQQNPIGNPADHLKVLQNKKKLEARGSPSLQNVLQLAKTGLSHLPPHGSREVIVILGSLTTTDPTNIHQTIAETEAERIRVNIIGLSADMKICRDICEQTNGVYRVARDDLAFRDLLFEFVLPPPTFAPSKSHVLGGPSPAAPTSSADLMQMGFPGLISSTFPGVCSCHGKLKTTGYSCPRCKARLCDVPTECRVCGLTVVNAPQLARSYRHLFPVTNYERVMQTSDDNSPSCFSCAFPFTTLAHAVQSAQLGYLSPLGRYRCPKCMHHFCLECDKLVHDALGFCPGCCE
ncbi:General transcription and DNA repair factor IIH subunit SSL1 [Rhodotorula toruloides]|uniref:General transcription and DNA repair factor IIH n=1 Tax=Rhodotorula toruloides TaxID=5286 RepID=A0A0K3CB55_RHOTO|nr:General transcription and DNA repair factor IIH subunit SSL1 [Rhodotorula toruloides]